MAKYIRVRIHEGLAKRGDFAKKMSPALMPVPKAHRPQLERLLHDLASQKFLREELKLRFEEDKKFARTILRKVVRIKAHYQNAIRELQRLDGVFPDLFDDERRFTLLAIRNLGTVVAAFDEYEKLFPTLIHPELRTEFEDRVGDPFRHGNMLPSLKPTSIDYWLIGKLDACLRDFVVQKKLFFGASVYNRIISAVFSAAFGKDGYTAGRIKTARGRIADKLKEQDTSAGSD
jgi:hypothetical protein